MQTSGHTGHDERELRGGIKKAKIIHRQLFDPTSQQPLHNYSNKQNSKIRRRWKKLKQKDDDDDQCDQKKKSPNVYKSCPKMIDTFTKIA